MNPSTHKRSLLHRTFEWLLVGLLGILSLLVFYQVLARYIPVVPPLLWTEEVSRGLLIWLVLLGAGLGVFEETHFRLSVLHRRFGRWLQPIVHALVFISGLYLTYSAFALAQRGMGRTSLVTGLPATWIYSALLVGGILIVVGAIAVVLRKRKELPDDPLFKDDAKLKVR